MTITITKNTTVKAEEMAAAIARADSKDQADFFYYLAAEIEHVHSGNYVPNSQSFCFQANYIASEEIWKLNPQKKDVLISILTDLLDHFEETQNET